jgi:hypothetical protein
LPTKGRGIFSVAFLFFQEARRKMVASAILADLAGTMQLSWGAQAAGLPCLAARQTLRPTILAFTIQCGEKW